MLGTLHGVGVDYVTATISQNCVPITDVLKKIMPEKKAIRLSKGTGIKSLSLADSTICTSDMCVESAERIFCKVDRQDIGALIFITQTPDYLSPATSYLLHDRLGLSHDVLAFDINLGCSGFCYGIFLASLLLPAIEGKKVLLLCGDTSSRNAYPLDSSMLSIAGDAGAAAIIGIRPEDETISYNIESYGELANLLLIARGGYRDLRIADENGMALRYDNYVVMDGMGVMDFTLKEVPHNISDLLSNTGIKVTDVDFAAFHQANSMIVSMLASNIGLSLEKTPFVSENIGNTSSASIPVCLAEMAARNMPHTGRCLMSGFGVGMSVASLLLKLDNTVVLPTGII